MAQDKSTDRKVRLSAPTYMRPQRPVLDSPLDIDAGKRVVEQPAVMDMPKTVEVDSSAVFNKKSSVAMDVAPQLAVGVEETLTSENLPIVDEVVPDPAEDMPIPEAASEEDLSAGNEEIPEAGVEEQPRRKGMTVFQQFIVLLLLLVVAAFLATLYLYTNGWIELPPLILDWVEKGLSLIR